MVVTTSTTSPDHAFGEFVEATNLDVDSGAWYLNTEEEKAHAREAYLAWLAAGNPTRWHAGAQPDVEVDGVITVDWLQQRVSRLHEAPQVHAVGSDAKQASLRALGGSTERTDEPAEPAEPMEPTEPAEVGHANAWAVARGIPRNRGRLRPSQTPAGRRARWLRRLAIEGRTSIAEQERLHPPKKETTP